MMTIKDLQTYHSDFQGPISGAFRVREPYMGETDAGRPFVRLRLEDCSGHLYAFSWHEPVRMSSGLFDLSRVYIEGEIRIQKEQPFVELTTLIPARVQYPDLIRLIPHSQCPQPEFLVGLQSALQAITLPALREFIAQVLNNDGITFPFVSCPASLNHHHNFPGGLLKHSLESFTMVESQSGLPRKSYELGLVAALFHDIGKILTLTPQMTRTTLGYGTEHNKLTIEILGPALQQLSYRWPEGAKELRYLLGWKAKSAIPHYNMADLVACSDRVSAGLDMAKRIPQ